MRKNPKGILRRIKQNMVESEAQRISEGLNSPSAVVVVATLNELKNLRDHLHFGEAKALLSNRADSVVIAAVKYLATMNHPFFFDEIEPLLKRSIRIRTELAKVTELMPFDQACSLLKVLLDDHSSVVKAAALRAIAKMKCEVLNEKVTELLDHKEETIRIEALKTLVAVGETVEEGILTGIIKNGSLPSKIRKAALKAYIETSPDPINLLIDVAGSSYPPLSSAALGFLGKLPCEDVWEAIKKALSNSGDLPERLSAALQGGTSGCAENEELEKFALEYVKHPSSAVRLAALKALASIDSPSAADIVNDFLKSEDYSLKTYAVQFVGQYPTVENVDELDVILKTRGENENVIAAAIKVLRRLGMKNEKIADYMEATNPLKIRVQALKALISADEISPDALVSMARSEEALKLRLEALDGLSKIAPEKLEEVVS